MVVKAGTQKRVKIIGGVDDFKLEGESFLGKITGYDLNQTAAAGTIFTTPAAGFTRCIVSRVVRDNDSAAAATTASYSLGSSGSTSDYAVTATDAAITSAKCAVRTGIAGGYVAYGVGVAFVVKASIAQGAAATADFSAFGYYE